MCDPLDVSVKPVPCARPAAHRASVRGTCIRRYCESWGEPRWRLGYRQDCLAAIGVDALRADLKHDFGIFDVKPRDASAKIIVHDKWAIEFCEVDQVVSGVKAGSGVQTHSRLVAVFSRQPDASWKVARVIALPG